MVRVRPEGCGNLQLVCRAVGGVICSKPEGALPPGRLVVRPLSTWYTHEGRSHTRQVATLKVICYWHQGYAPLDSTQPDSTVYSPGPPPTWRSSQSWSAATCVG